jgi:hypothetical protein
MKKSTYLSRSQALQMAVSRICADISSRIQQIDKQKGILRAEQRELRLQLEPYEMNQAVSMWLDSADGLPRT